RRQVDPCVVGLGRDRRLGEPRADLRRHVGRRRAPRVLPARTVGKRDADLFAHRDLSRPDGYLVEATNASMREMGGFRAQTTTSATTHQMITTAKTNHSRRFVRPSAAGMRPD